MAASTGLQERVALWNDGRKNDPTERDIRTKKDSRLARKRVQVKKRK